MSTTPDDERIALFLDYENLAIGTREQLSGMQFDLKPVADALAERGRVVTRKAYADWTYFDEDRRMLTRSHVELIEIPQRMGAVRKNAADIKMAVDAMELAFERDYITTFVICTGDSDFTPLVYKLRELNKRVIGVGVKASTSALLPPACDEFLFYENLDGVEVRAPESRERRSRNGDAEETPGESSASDSLEDLDRLIATTISGLQRTGQGAVLASSLKRALLRKDPTFTEADYGFRAFGELLAHLVDKSVIEVSEGPAKGDPLIEMASNPEESEAFRVLGDVVSKLEDSNGTIVLSGLKNQLRKQIPTFSEKKFGYGSFLQFVKAAQTRGLLDLNWDSDLNDYSVAPTS
jgi:uncharacterized protein (TIGR00288 family)